MKNQEIIIKLTGVDTSAFCSEFSMIDTSNLSKLGFKVVDIGSVTKGFNREDIATIPYYISNQDHVNIIINAHGSIRNNPLDNLDYYVLSTNSEYHACGFTLINHISHVIKESLGQNIKINIILTSCKGKTIHDTLKTMNNDFPLGSKIYSLSDSNTVVSDLFSKRIDKFVELSSIHGFTFNDLIKLYCISKRSSENVPVISTQTEKGWKTISFEEITQDLIQKTKGNIVYSNFLNSVFEHNILSKDIMKNNIDKVLNISNIFDLKVPHDLIQKISFSIISRNDNEKKEIISDLSKKYYSDQSLDFLTFSYLNNSNENFVANNLKIIFEKFPLLKDKPQERLKKSLDSKQQFDNSFKNNPLLAQVKIMRDIEDLTGISVFDVFTIEKDSLFGAESLNKIYKNLNNINEVFQAINCMLDYNYLLEQERTNIKKITKEAKLPFLFESELCLNLEQFGNFEHDNILSNHSYLMVLGADNLDHFNF